MMLQPLCVKHVYFVFFGLDGDRIRILCRLECSSRCVPFVLLLWSPVMFGIREFRSPIARTVEFLFSDRFLMWEVFLEMLEPRRTLQPIAYCVTPGFLSGKGEEFLKTR